MKSTNARLLIMVLLAQIFLQCGNVHKTDVKRNGKVEGNDTSVIKNNKQKDNIIDCDSVIIKLVRSSSIESDLKGYSVKCNGLIDSTLLIKIYNINELNMESALANLALDTKHKMLKDETADVDSPIVLKCDTTLLNYAINHCINWSDNQQK